MRKKTVWFSRFPMTDVNLQLTFIRKFCAFVKTNSIQFYLFLQVELERVFFVLLALLYEQEYMDTAEKKKWTFKVITWVQYHKIFLSRNTELHVDREGVTCQKTPQFGKKNIIIVHVYQIKWRLLIYRERWAVILLHWVNYLRCFKVWSPPVS